MRATKVNAGLAESNGKLLLGIWRDSLYVTCGLTACTPGSAPGPTLGDEYGKTLPFLLTTSDTLASACRVSCPIRSLDDISVPRKVPSEVGFPILPRTCAEGFILGNALRGWEPVSTEGCVVP